jgi:hypothetical protein
MSIKINILLNGVSVLKSITKCEITHDGGACLACDLEFGNMQYWKDCNPVIQYGNLIFKVVIGSDDYEFLCEERQLGVSKTGEDGQVNVSEFFTVWGRSKQAFLTQKFCGLINDTEDSDHLWQIHKKTYASAVIQQIITDYAYVPIIVNFNISDFYIFRDGFTVSNKEPLAVIKEIAEGVGAEIIGQADGSLTIQSYDVTGAVVCDITDFDDFIEYSENIQYQSGYNAVTVYGYDSESEMDNTGGSGSGGGNTLSASGVSELPVDVWGDVKVYYSCPEGLWIEEQIQSGAEYQEYGMNVDTIPETVELSWGVGNTSMPDVNGVTAVSGDKSQASETVVVEYDVKFKQYKVKSGEPGTYKITFWFQDHSAETSHTFTVTAEDGGGGGEGEDEDLCAGITVSTTTPEVAPGATVEITFVNPESLPVVAESTAGQSVDVAAVTPDYTVFTTKIPSDYTEKEAVISFQAGECESVEVIITVLHESGGVPPPPGTPNNNPAALSAKWKEGLPAEAYTGYVYVFRAYGWHPTGLPVLSDSAPATASIIQTNSGLEPQNETVTMKFGVGETQYPDVAGSTTVIANPAYPLATKTVNYNTPYWEFGFSGTEVGTYKILIYFSDKSVDTELEITLVEPPDPPATTKPEEILYIYWEEDPGVPVPEADIYTDPAGNGVFVYAGKTDGAGEIILHDHTIGNHVVKIIKTGWMPSDEDDLSNDTFEILP